MERIVWVVDNDRNELLQTQRSISSTGGMKTSLFFSFEALEKQMNNLIDKQAANSMPAIVLIDYMMAKQDEFISLDRILNIYEGISNSIPVIFMIKEISEDVENNCFSRGAITILKKPLNATSISRIEQIAWRFHIARRAAVKMEQQSIELMYARQIRELNEKLNKRNELLYKTFGMYFNDEILAEILNGDNVAAIGGRKCEATIMMADLRGFTAMSSIMQTEALMDMINVYFSSMSDIIMSFKGTVIEFLGDGILAVFGAPIKSDNHSEQAVAAAIVMQNKMEEVKAYCKDKGYPIPEMGIGLHLGEILIGNIGSEKLMRYNVLGTTVNQAARIESYSVGGQVLASKQVISHISCPCITEYYFNVYGKGMETSIEATSIKEIKGDFDYRLYDAPGEYTIFEEPLKTVLTIIEDKKLTTQIIKADILAVKAKRAIAVSDTFETIHDFEDVYIEVSGYDNIKGNYGKVLHRRNSIIEIAFTRLDNSMEELLMKCRVNISDFTIKEISGKEEADDAAICSETDYTLLFLPGNYETELFFNSNNSRIRAMEFMDFLSDDFGKIRGDNRSAKGILPSSVIKTDMAENDKESIKDYLEYKVNSYINGIDWIDSTEYAYSNKEDINSYTRYVKKEIPWAVVDLTNLLPDGGSYSIKSLENESGEVHNKNDNELIMIGKKGEVYCIEREKFERTYRYSEEDLDIFEMGFEYIPEIYIIDSENYMTIDDKAKLCYPKKGNAILAKKLEKRTKVFNRIAGNDYFLGNPGDYIAIREDDYSDIYIIKGDIFEETYSEII